jgi:lauroyl/myristoyl acyltransferase
MHLLHALHATNALLTAAAAIIYLFATAGLVVVVLLPLPQLDCCITLGAWQLALQVKAKQSCVHTNIFSASSHQAMIPRSFYDAACWVAMCQHPHVVFCICLLPTPVA